MNKNTTAKANFWITVAMLPVYLCLVILTLVYVINAIIFIFLVTQWQKWDNHLREQGTGVFEPTLVMRKLRHDSQGLPFLIDCQVYYYERSNPFGFVSIRVKEDFVVDTPIQGHYGLSFSKADLKLKKLGFTKRVSL